ncbi:MAG: DUF1501 domain-containing protein [Planctomycetota bacterium]
MSALTRRNFLGAVAGAAALTVSPIPVLRMARAANAPDNGKFLVVVNLFGGNDGLNTVIPTHLQPYYDRRPGLALGSGLFDLDGRYQMHPALAHCKSLWDSSELHVVQKVGYPNQNLSHFTSQNIYSYGVRDYTQEGDGRGWLGRFADTYCADPVEPLGVVSVGTGRRLDFEADTGEALILSRVENFDIEEDRDFRTDHDLRRRVAKDVLASEDAPEDEPGLTVFGTSKQAHTLVERVQAGVSGWTDPGNYPDTTLGRNMRAVSQLLYGRDDFKTKVFYTGFGGFDTHSGQLSRHQTLLSQLDGALSAFTADLRNRQMWDDCIVVVISEFGRRNFENGSAGTDHGHGNAFLLAGGPVAGMQITGDLSEADLNLNQPDYSYDFREIYADLITNHIGVPATPIFPETYPSTGDIQLVS